MAQSESDRVAAQQHSLGTHGMAALKTALDNAVAANEVPPPDHVCACVIVENIAMIVLLNLSTNGLAVTYRSILTSLFD